MKTQLLAVILTLTSTVAFSKARSLDDSATCSFKAEKKTGELVITYTGFAKSTNAVITYDHNPHDVQTGVQAGEDVFEKISDLSELKNNSAKADFYKALEVDVDAAETLKIFQFTAGDSVGELDVFLDKDGRSVGSVAAINGFPFVCAKSEKKPAIGPIPVMSDAKAYINVCDIRKLGCSNSIVVKKQTYRLAFDKSADEKTQTTVQKLIAAAQKSKKAKTASFSVRGYLGQVKGIFPNPMATFDAYIILNATANK